MGILTDEDFAEIQQSYTGTREDFDAIVAADDSILHDGRGWGFNDTVVRERIGAVSETLGLEVFN